MTPPLTPTQLRAIRERLALVPRAGTVQDLKVIYRLSDGAHASTEAWAASCADIPALLAEVERLHAEVEYEKESSAGRQECLGHQMAFLSNTLIERDHEVERLNARVTKMLPYVQTDAIKPLDGYRRFECRLCGQSWSIKEPPAHAPDCLAAEVTP